MEIIKRNKTAHRASFTRAYNKLENILADENSSFEEVEISLVLFKQKSNTLELTHNTYLDTLKEQEFETEFDSVEEYREKSLRIQLKAQRFLENHKKLNVK